MRNAAAFFITLILQLGVGYEANAEDYHLGIVEYEISCMPCHGLDGRGDGPRAKTLKVGPADLTKIAQSNRGVFPSEKVAEIIDGRATVAAHGMREMPVWGNRYRVSVEAGDNPIDIERRAREQIAALVRYLKSIQKQ
jgi:hypothetical protein